jgi:hypothetical protein
MYSVRRALPVFGACRRDGIETTFTGEPARQLRPQEAGAATHGGAHETAECPGSPHRESCPGGVAGGGRGSAANAVSGNRAGSAIKSSKY